MSNKYPGGLVTLNPPAQDPALGAATPGIWTLDQALNAETNRSWAMYDPYYKNVVLNLHGDAAVGGSFVSDASTNNFTPTISGNPIANTGTALSGSRNFANGSGYFNGSTDYIDFASNAAFAFGTGDFTIEAWVYTTASGRQDWFDLNNGTSANRIQFIYDGTNVAFYNNASLVAGGAYTPTLSTWTHYALVRASGTAKVYVNGTQVGSSGSSSTNFAANPVRIAHDDSTQWATGRMSNVRVVKGTAVYTGAFATPSLLPLTTDGATSAASYSSTTNVNTSFAASATSLLTLQTPNPATNNGFVDSSSNNFTITRNGNTTQGSFSPYGPSWSNYFDGSGDYLQFTYNSAFTFGSGDFTIEAFVFSQRASGVTAPIAAIWDDISSAPQSWVWYLTTSGAIAFAFDDAGTDVAILTSPQAIPANTWVHVAVVRSGSTWSMYVNGISVVTATSSATMSAGSAWLGVGSYQNNTTTSFNGYISNFRIVKGTAVYTSNFTPSATPLTNITNTKLLTCQSNRFVDNSTANSGSGWSVAGVGGTPSVQRFQPFLFNTSYTPSTIGGSGYFDGTGDYLTLADNAAFQMGTSTFCLECWFYSTGTTGAGQVLLSKWNVGGTGDYIVSFENNQKIVFFTGIVNITSTNTYAYNTWHHVACVRSGSNFALFVNGVRDGTGTSASSLSNSGTGFGICCNTGNSNTNNVKGYVSDVRVIKGSTPYDPTSSTITIPTTPLTAITNTSLLTSMTNAGIYDNAMMNNLETVGNAQVSTSVVKYGSGSLYFDGSGDFLYAPASPNEILGNTWTIECWYNAISASATYPCILSVSDGNSNYANTISLFDRHGGASGKFSFAVANGGALVSGTTSVVNNIWYHLALVSNNGVVTLYVNGIAETSASLTTGSANKAVYIGANFDYASYSTYLNGYIDDLRITKGVARYTANFQPPKVAFPNQ